MKTWLRLAVVLSIVALAGVAAQAADDEIVLDLAQDTEAESVIEAEVDFSSALEPLDLEPAAVCRMRPQCDVDADCHAFCGAGQGDCVRAKCPIRVCRCD